MLRKKTTAPNHSFQTTTFGVPICAHVMARNLADAKSLFQRLHDSCSMVVRFDVSPAACPRPAEWLKPFWLSVRRTPSDVDRQQISWEAV
jgi:hypothetical protein